MSALHQATAAAGTPWASTDGRQAGHTTPPSQKDRGTTVPASAPPGTSAPHRAHDDRLGRSPENASAFSRCGAHTAGACGA